MGFHPPFTEIDDRGEFAEHAHRAQGRPVQDFQIALVIFRQGRATLHPVAVIAIQHIADHAFVRMMNVTAHNAVDAAAFPLTGKRLFIITNKSNGVFNLML